ncbi:MAG TPA: hypothetical protein VFI24_06870 [Pyrinomonadaceae bacterium]|nr:hypothetical protein [Pyrinomonadaceae bacterium]
MSVISSITDNITHGLGQDFNVALHGGEALLDAAQASASQAFSVGANLAEVYASRVGTDLLPAGLSNVVNLSSRAEPRPDTVFDGVFVGANGQTFPATKPLNQIPAVQPRNGVTTNETLIYVNGINTTKDAQAASLQAIADRTGARVIGIHNSTEGMISDLRQCVTDKLDVGTNPPVDTLADTVYNEIQAGRTVHLLAHSQGALITSRALRDVYQRLRIEDGLSSAEAEQRLSQVKVETFGGAAGHYPDGPQYVHYVNRDDPVPSLFGLGWDIDRFNPTLDAGRGAQVHWFTDWHLNPIASHSFEDVYLPQRVPFDQARRGDFD